MKKLLIGLLLMSPIALAGEFQVHYMSESTRIVLSKTACSGDGFRAAAQNINNTFTRGCWTVTKNNMIHIQWADGDFSEFSPDIFNETPDTEMKRVYK
jgi:hypothetical protein|tara:strand:+ start:294 stop:587 length:294 start_codon:yes stop_codon:yes gene_type:complete